MMTAGPGLMLRMFSGYAERFGVAPIS